MEENWVTAEQVLEKVHIYGKKKGIIAELSEELKERDALYLIQIGNHLFVALHYHEEKISLISDGLNSFTEDNYARRILNRYFIGSDLRSVPFFGQNQDNRCGSAAAAIILQYQKVYPKREIPRELRPEKVFFSTVNRVLHKVECEKLTQWTSIEKQKVGVYCSKCNKHWRCDKNRAILNLHPCEPK